MTDLKEGFAEIEAGLKQEADNWEMERTLKSIDRGERLDELLTALEKRDNLVLTVEGIDIKIVRTLTRKQRREGIRLSKLANSDAIEHIEKEMYNYMATLCIEAPFDNPISWEVLDEETGEAPNLLKEAMDLINKEAEAVAGFRR